jgi:hypothetical protein
MSRRVPLNPEMIVRAYAHQIAAEMMRNGIEVKEVRGIATLESGYDVIVLCVPHVADRPSHVRIDLPPLREIEQSILEAAPDNRPVTARKLSVLSGYSYSSYFRSAIGNLLKLGLLIRVSGGLQKSVTTP